MKEWIDYQEMNKDLLHIDDTVPVTTEQRDALEVATAETKETDKNEDQEKAPESAVMQMKASNDP